jgi:hypothetical protein
VESNYETSPFSAHGLAEVDQHVFIFINKRYLTFGKNRRDCLQPETSMSIPVKILYIFLFIFQKENKVALNID